MSPAEKTRPPSKDSTKANHNEAQAQPRGEAASYFDRTQSFGSPLPEGQGLSDRDDSGGRATHVQNPYGYSENAVEAGETYSGTAPPISYQETLPGSTTAPAAPAGGHPPPLMPVDGSSGNVDMGGPATGVNDEGNQEPLQSATSQSGPHIRPGKRGTIKGFVALARKKPHVREDTPARLELLRRADKFFNEGFIGKHGRLNKEKTALFRQEIDRVEAKLAQM